MLKNMINNWIARIRNSSFIKSVLTLSAGVVVSQAIALFTTPIISRIYDPQVIGDFSLVLSNSTIIGTVICMGLIPAIMLPPEEDQAKGVCRLILKLIVGGATVLLLAALALSGVWRMFSVNMDYREACVLLWALVVLENTSSLCYSYVNRQKMYKVLFWNPSLGTVSNAVFSITLGLVGWGLRGYMLANLLSKALIIVHMLRHANPFRGRVQCTSWGLLKKYKDFPLVMLPSNLVGTLSSQLPIQMLSWFWGNAVLGSYSMCMTILKLPARFLAAPVNSVFYREASERANRGENIGEFAFSLIKANIKLAVIPFFLLIVLGRPLFSIVLGEKWADAGDFASVMSIQVLLNFCTSCLSGKFVIIGKKKTILMLNIIVMLSNVGVFLISHFAGLTAFGAIVAFSLMGGLMTILDMSVFMKQTGISLCRFYRFVLLYLLLPVAVGIMLRLGLQFFVLA